MRVNAPLLSLILALLATGCASSHGHKSSWPYPEEPRAPQPGRVPEEATPGTPSAIPQGKPLSSFPKSAEDISNGAVLSLLNQAREQRAAGAPDQAAAALERALRIEPRNYFVWAMLAQVHLEQKNYDQAETVAQRSNSLARGNLYVEIENWKTIASARQQRGDADGASQAQARVQDIERILAGG